MSPRLLVALAIVAVAGVFAFIFGSFDVGLGAQFQAVEASRAPSIQPIASIVGYVSILAVLLMGLIPVARNIFGSASLDRTVRGQLFAEGATVDEEAVRDTVGITTDELVRIFGRGKRDYSYRDYLRVRRYVRRHAGIRDLRRAGVAKQLARASERS